LKSGQQLPEVSATRREFPAMSFRSQLADGRSLTHARQRTSPQEIWLRTWASKSVPPPCAHLKRIFSGSVYKSIRRNRFITRLMFNSLPQASGACGEIEAQVSERSAYH
jgi:hypothetical protein